jgi:hypothetical protein
MAELILGRLNDGKATNVFQTYVLNGKTSVVDGWKQLQYDAENHADWNPGALQLVCKTAIGCITPSSEGRLSTGVLLPLLHHAIMMNAGGSDVVQGDDIDDVIAEFRTNRSGRGYSAITLNARESHVVQGEEIDSILATLNTIRSRDGNSANTANAGQSYVVDGICIDKLMDTFRAMKTGLGRSDPDGAGYTVLCSICNEQPHVLKCKGESHLLCANCLDDAVQKAPASTPHDFRLSCPFVGCASQPFKFKDVKRHVNSGIWSFLWQKNTAHCFKEAKELQRDSKPVVDEIHDGETKVPSVVATHFSKLALNTEIPEEWTRCPALASITPSDADGPEVGKPNAIFSVQGQPSVVCSRLQTAGTTDGRPMEA